jgi:hypothetical protein
MKQKRCMHRVNAHARSRRELSLPPGVVTKMKKSNINIIKKKLLFNPEYSRRVVLKFWPLRPCC